MQIRRRIRQGLTGLRPRIPADRDAILAASLSPVAAAHFRTLPVYDQQHLCAVHRWLHNHGETDPDLLAAALLHDVGKSTPEGKVRLPDRVARVLLEPIAPGLMARLATPPPRGWRAGLVLAKHHPQIGAEIARQLGCSERTVWLIAHHETHPLPPDPELFLLTEADRQSAALM